MDKAADKEREFHFTGKDFEKIRQMIYDHAGIALTPQKHDMVYSRVARRLRANRLQSFAEYLVLLENDNGNEWEEFVNSLTTNLTSFFREAHHFPVLADLARKHPKGMTVWCSASSTGEEPYSIAMTLAEAYDTLTPPVRILASDLDTQVLAKAAAGVYPLDRVEKLAPAQLKRFFQKGTGSKEGYARVRQELRDLITFRQINLLEDGWPVRGPLDVIFCRNVMIYFDKATQRKILQRFAPLMAPHGLLFAGHSESFNNSADLFRLRGKTIYEPVHRLHAPAHPAPRTSRAHPAPTAPQEKTMNQETIALVQESWKKVAAIAPQAAELFYQNLFAADPNLKPLFRGNMEEQGRKLMQMIGAAVGKLKDLDSLVPILQGLGKRHVGYGVKDSHYQTVGGALVKTLGQGLGEDFTPEVKAAWITTYGVMADVMIAASKA